MNLNVKLTPTKVVARNHQELMNKILSNHTRTTSTIFGSGWTKITGRYGNTETVRVYSVERVRAKYKQERHKKTNEEKGYVAGQTKKSVLVREAHCVAYVYDIKIALLEALGLKVEQIGRTWKLSKNRR